MRILAHVHLMPPSHCAGAELMLLAFMHFLRDRGHEVIVVKEYRRGVDGDYEWEGFPIIDRPSHDRLLTLYWWADVVLTHLDPTRKAIEYARKTLRPLVHIVHNDSQLKFHRVQPEEASLVVFNSRWLVDPSWRGRWVVVPPPVTAADWRVKRNPDADAITLINLTENKGANIFYEIARQMPERHFIAVKGGYGVQEIAPDYPNLEVYRHTPDIKEVYKQTRIQLMPSAYESWGRVAIEAASSGIPVIAHPTPGLVESIAHGATFIPRDQPRRWVAAIRALDDHDRYEAASNAAYQRALDLDPRPSLYTLEAELLLAANYPLPVKYRLAAPENQVHAFSSRRWYLDHMAPVWKAIPKNQRQYFHLGSSDLMPYAEKLGIENATIGFPQLKATGTWLVASFHDLKMIHSTAAKVVMMEHGVGQTYSMKHRSYADGPGRDHVKLYLCPNIMTAERVRKQYPEVQTLVIGSPRLDAWRNRTITPQSRPTVVISFHWTSDEIPELKSAFPYYETAIPELKQHFNLMGHSHPIVANQFRKFYRAHGIPFVETFEEVLEQASVYVCDNSSTLFEFAATGRPVVLLNAPWYRRHIESGLRFWSHAKIGVQCDTPGDLVAKIQEALSMPEEEKKVAKRTASEALPSDTSNPASKVAATGVTTSILERKKAPESLVKKPASGTPTKMLVLKNFLAREQGGNRPVKPGEQIMVSGDLVKRYADARLAVEVE